MGIKLRVHLRRVRGVIKKLLKNELKTVFTIKLYARSNIFNVPRNKHGGEALKIIRNLELITEHLKVKLDIDFVIKCRCVGLIPMFASAKLATRHGT